MRSRSRFVDNLIRYKRNLIQRLVKRIHILVMIRFLHYYFFKNAIFVYNFLKSFLLVDNRYGDFPESGSATGNLKSSNTSGSGTFSVRERVASGATTVSSSGATKDSDASTVSGDTVALSGVTFVSGVTAVSSTISSGWR